MPSVYGNDIINTLQEILSVSSHKIFVVAVLADVSVKKNSLNQYFVQETDLCGKCGVIILVVNKALFVFREVFENGVLLFIDII